MPKIQKVPIILMAEDDEDDYLLTLEAFKEIGIKNQLRRVRDGEELMSYLKKNGVSADSEDCPRPSLILLDLNMPKMDGREALSQIKADPDLRGIPVTILTTSDATSDIIGTYQSGSNSFIQKAARFRGFVDQIKAFCEYWLKTVKLPG